MVEDLTSLDERDGRQIATDKRLGFRTLIPRKGPPSICYFHERSSPQPIALRILLPFWGPQPLGDCINSRQIFDTTSDENSISGQGHMALQPLSVVYITTAMLRHHLQVALRTGCILQHLRRGLKILRCRWPRPPHYLGLKVLPGDLTS